MDLLNPYALLLLPLVAVLLFVARRQTTRPRRAIANLYLWKETRLLDPASLAMRRLRKHRLLALQIAFMVAVIAALSRPAITWYTRQATFVVDISASMGARDGSTTRLELVRRRARAVIETLPSRTRVRLIAAAGVPTDLGEFALADPRLSRALAALRPSAGAADLAAAIGMAHAIGGDRELYAFSDAPAPNLDGGAAVHWVRVGDPAENMAITALAARRLPLSPGDGEVLVELRNFGVRPYEAPVEISQGDAIVAREVVRLEPRSTRTLVKPFHDLGGVIRAQLAVSDALDVDNQRAVLLPGADPVAVLLTTRGSFFLEKALSSNPRLAVDRERRPGVRYDVIVCDGCPVAPPDGAGVLLIPQADDQPGEPGRLTIGRADHPILAELDLADAVGKPALRGTLPVGADDDVLLRAGGVPVVTASDRDDRRIVTLNLNVTSATLPLSTAFPVLIANAVDWLAARDRNHLEVAPGEPWQATVGDAGALGDAAILGPTGERLPLQVSGRHLTFTSTNDAGVYRWHGPEGDRTFVVNAETDSESDLAGTDTVAAAKPGSALTVAPGSPETSASGVSLPALVRGLLIGALLLLLTEWWFWSPQDRRRAATVCRCAVVGLIAFTVVGLQLPWGLAATHVMFVLDRSGSLPALAQARALARVNEMTAGMHATDRAGLVAFAEDAAIERRPDEALRVDQVASTLSGAGTNIELALRTARAALPRDGARRIVLMSDGRETAGQAGREAALAAAAGVRIDVVPLDAAGSQRPVAVTGVTAPADVRLDEPFVVSVDVAGAPGARGRVTIWRGGDTVTARDILLPATGVTSLSLTDQRPQAGVYAYHAVARAEGEDEFGTDASDRMGTMVSVSGRPSVLLVGASAAPLAGVLAGAGYRLRQVGAGDLPSTADLAAYDAVVLDDVPPGSLGADGARALTAYVEQAGGGLLMLGGPQSLDAAGYPEGPLGKLLPVDLRPRNGRRGPAMGLVIIFDKSGSMADVADGVPKIEVARQAVKRVLDVVPATDSIGVLAFDSAPTVIAPLTASPDATAIASRLRGLEPGGATAIAPAMTLAADWLGRAAVSRRYVLLMSDGRTAPADADRLREAARAGGIELSVIAIGADADRALLERLAQGTGGRAYFPDDIRDLPILAAREAARAAGGGVVQEHFALRAAAHPITTGLDRASMPDMGGYVVSVAKPGAEPILMSHLDDPVLAGWRSGLGRVAVYTAGLNAPWSASLRAWSGFAPLWLQTVRWLSRRTAHGALQASVVERADGMHLVVDTTTSSGELLNLSAMRAVVREPGGREQDVAVHARAPGLYEARLDAAQPGPYLVSVSGRSVDGVTDVTALRGFYWSANRERRASGVDVAALTALSQMTGGRRLGPGESPFTGARPRAYHEVWPVLALAALLIFLVEIALRRNVLPWRRAGRDGHAPSISQAAA